MSSLRKARAVRKARATAPRCVFCGRDRSVQFVIFNPRFAPFGTACVECERTLPPGTVLPAEPAAPAEPQDGAP